MYISNITREPINPMEEYCFGIVLTGSEEQIVDQPILVYTSVFGLEHMTITSHGVDIHV